MREYEYYEPVQQPRMSGQTASQTASRPSAPKSAPKVNRAAIVLGDPVMILGAFLQVLSRRKR